MSVPPSSAEASIPERQLAEERFRDLFALSADWLWEQDTDLRFSWFSSNYLQGGANHKYYLGLHRWDLPLELTAEAMAAHRAQLAARQSFRDLEYSITTPDGQKRWYSISGLPMFENGKFAGYRGIGREITRHKRLEAELREHRDHLEDMVRAQTSDLLRAKEAAERANQAKSEFLTNMSHELRTPLHAVLAFARLGHQRAGKTESDKLKEYFELIRTSGNHLLELVDDLLDLAKLETGNARFAFERLDLRARLEQVLDGLSALLEDKQLACQVSAGDIPALVAGDPKRIDQLLRNLIANAIKFSPPGGGIRIEIAAAGMPRGRRQGDVGESPALRLSVMDQGVGIPAGELETIFDKFVQSSLTASGAGGTGLGLAICREIVQAHRGIIRARNRAEGGAAFEVLLPPATQDHP